MHRPALERSRHPANQLVVFLQPLLHAALVELVVSVEEDRSPWGHGPRSWCHPRVQLGSGGRGGIAVAALGVVWAPHKHCVLLAHWELKVQPQK